MNLKNKTGLLTIEWERQGLAGNVPHRLVTTGTKATKLNIIAGFFRLCRGDSVLQLVLADIHRQWRLMFVFAETIAASTFKNDL